MNAAILPDGEGGFEIMVFRSMAGTLVREVGHAMRAVAARGTP